LFEFSPYDFDKAPMKLSASSSQLVTPFLVKNKIFVIVGLDCSLLLFWSLSLVGDAVTAMHATAVKPSLQACVVCCCQQFVSAVVHLC